jgi:hypothetical protein
MRGRPADRLLNVLELLNNARGISSLLLVVAVGSKLGEQNLREWRHVRQARLSPERINGWASDGTILAVDKELGERLLAICTCRNVELDLCEIRCAENGDSDLVEREAGECLCVLLI